MSDVFVNLYLAIKEWNRTKITFPVGGGQIPETEQKRENFGTKTSNRQNFIKSIIDID